MQNKFDIIIVGGGHAGVEAANVGTLMGCHTALLTMSLNTICKPSCNPNIGGAAKGHIVKEIDALGGIQGALADVTGIHFKMLNTSKGPAIWSPRAQIDKDLYPKTTYNYLLNLNKTSKGKLTVIENTITEILIEKEKVIGCVTTDNSIFYCKVLILCAGTFLNGKMFIGKNEYFGGRWNEPHSEKVSDLLTSFGIKKGRLKTGTPPRIHKDSINYSKLKVEPGDNFPKPFSYRTQSVQNKIVCYGTETNAQTHEILRTGFDDSPMFSGLIEGIGPRYCPSIEDKIVRFAQRDSHKITLEPEGLNTASMYVNGYSTSLPLDIQVKGLESINGLENCQLIDAGYAIEYDYFYPHQNKFTLETQAIENLFFAGQINGTSGYEEAACQGLVAGINAVLKIYDMEPFILKRSEAYIGVLIDDLVNKSTQEPYRMFTSLAEYRLLLRQDNAAQRLVKYGHQFGLIPDWYYENVLAREEVVNQALALSKTVKIKKEYINDYLCSIGETSLINNPRLYEVIKRGNVNAKDILALLSDLPEIYEQIKSDDELAWKFGIEIKYDGYIEKQRKEVEYFLDNENKSIPKDFNYDILNSISNEARQKLKQICPLSIGQAARISGISATDIMVISFYLNRR